MNERAKDEIILFTGNANPALARDIAADLGVSLGKALIRTFSDGEIMVEVADNVRGGDVFIMQSICTPPNDSLMELLLMLDAL
ncbi:MAG: ribose-phosphate pyrophosphokinase-like domain-containing protein, partial [Candidatus Binatia bacterium]